MIIDGGDGDAEFGGDLLVTHALHPAHHKDAPRLGRHGAHSPPIEAYKVGRLDPPCLVGPRNRIALLGPRVQCDGTALPSARAIAEQMWCDPGQIELGRASWRERWCTY